MALHEIEIPSNAIDVAINADASAFAILHNQGISLFEWKSTSAASPEPELTARITFEKLYFDSVNFQQIVFGQDSQISALQRCGEEDLVKSFGFNTDSGRLEESKPELETPNPISRIAALSSFLEDGKPHVFVQGRNGQLHSLENTGSNNIAHISSGIYLPWLEIVPHNGTYIAFGMTTHGHLYANSRQLVKNCTSFIVTAAHLIFTTTTHMLKFVHLTDVNGK